MKSQKEAQNQGLQLGTGQGQAHRVRDLVASVEQSREELARGGGGVRDQLWGWGSAGTGVRWWMALLTRAGQRPQGHQERSRKGLEYSWQREEDAPRGRGDDVKV